MDIQEALDALRTDSPSRIAAAGDLEQLAAVEVETVGKSSPIAEGRRGLGAAPEADRRELGRAINEVAIELESLIAARRAELEQVAHTQALSSDAVDVTLPGRAPKRGTTHLIQQTLDEVVDIFVAMGYTVATGPEAETEYYNFTALNFPPAHPTRLESDTLYLDYGDVPEEILLRTHTSPMQARYMEQHDPPVYLVVPGRTYRSDPLDPTHSPVFHQVEGLAVDTDITFGDLKGVLEHFAREFLGSEAKVKFIPHFFPFTEPSAEMHVWHNGDWMELLGCGMVNPAVFEAVGYDPDEVTGFAFGMGADRLAMARHGITDLRHLLDPDLRSMEQYR
ncbi:MAG: phenylalanine--tRNA ligase subunit alpha [Acidimicrobiia bacterium]|nr:MAG: phenylalanine--tRNA ligase subunit alpha [Acidimicrobiia bacterium]